VRKLKKIRELDLTHGFDGEQRPKSEAGTDGVLWQVLAEI